MALTRGHAGGDRQAAACAAGVEVRSGAAAELVVEGGRVTGVGYLASDRPAGVTCSSVVLALDAVHWDFVGPAVWSIVRTSAVDRRPPDPGRSSRLGLVGPDHTRPEPELVVRRWCADGEAGSAAAANQRPLQVEESTGLLMISEQLPVPGLYSAVPARSGASAERDIGAARRAGRAAALLPRAGRVVLRSGG
jgi:hypothetical protein